MATDSPPGTGSGDPILSAFTGPLPEVRVGFVYRFGLAIIALTMVLLPLVYVALIAAAAFGVLWHMTANAAMLGSGLYGALAYLTPLFVGGVLVVFMVKPLFAPRAPEMEPVELTPADEPRLHAFIHRLCEVVGAPRPRKIVVDCEANASAGFRRGFVSLLGNDLVLTIGLPLAGGLSLRGLSGVLAHEFGHFAQRTGMRLTYVIRSVNGWFSRVVYTRDAWDEGLRRATEWDIRIAVIIWIAQLFVWLTRGVLWILMMIGHALSCFMLRQMEFDADRYEAHLAGSEDFESTARRLPLLAVGVQGAQADLEESMHDDRLVDDFVALALENEASLPEAVREEVRRLVEEETTGLLDTHPATAARIASVAALEAPGLFAYDGPATDLFADFEALSRVATRDLYAVVLGEEAAQHRLVPFAQYIAERNVQVEEMKAVRRYFQDVVHPLRPLIVPDTTPAAQGDRAALEAEIRQERAALVQGIEAHRQEFQAFDELDSRRLVLRHARALLEAELMIDRYAFELQTGNLYEVQQVQSELDHRVGELLPRLAGLEEVAARRFWAALSLARAGVGADGVEGGAGAQRAAVDHLLPAAINLSAALPQLVILRDEAQALMAQLQELEENEDHEPLYAAIMHTAENLKGQVREFGNSVRATTYPLEAEGPAPTLRDYLLGEVPEDDDIGEALLPAQSAVDRGYRTYHRVLGRLCQIAERVEGALGLDLLEDPPDPTPPGDADE